ncbi:hypothetical protein D3C78_1940180 [compost metagenome]
MISNATLTCEVLRMAVELRGHPKEVLFHSDQGAQYTNQKFRNEMRKQGLLQSMSRNGGFGDS